MSSTSGRDQTTASVVCQGGFVPALKRGAQYGHFAAVPLPHCGDFLYRKVSIFNDQNYNCLLWNVTLDYNRAAP
jgi:hypothetical protein